MVPFIRPRPLPLAPAIVDNETSCVLPVVPLPIVPPPVLPPPLFPPPAATGQGLGAAGEISPRPLPPNTGEPVWLSAEFVRLTPNSPLPVKVPPWRNVQVASTSTPLVPLLVAVIKSRNASPPARSSMAALL